MQVLHPSGPDSTSATIVKPEEVPTPAQGASDGTHKPDGTETVTPAILEVNADQPVPASEDVNMPLVPATESKEDDTSTALEAEAKRSRR
jgi:hypothetical protein